jgi:hypothetical protein
MAIDLAFEQPRHQAATRNLEEAGRPRLISSQLQNAVPGAMLARKATIATPDRRKIQ